MHFTPTGSSWLNQVVRWFGFLTDKLILHGVRKSVQALETDIREWIETWNQDPKPFARTKTAHIYTPARDNGQDISSAAPLPLAGDGLIAGASSAMLVASRQARDVPALARVMLLAGIGATIAANVGYGLSAGITVALLSVWPVATSFRERRPAC